MTATCAAYKHRIGNNVLQSNTTQLILEIMSCVLHHSLLWMNISRGMDCICECYDFLCFLSKFYEFATYLRITHLDNIAAFVTHSLWTRSL